MRDIEIERIEQALRKALVDVERLGEGPFDPKTVEEIQQDLWSVQRWINALNGKPPPGSDFRL